MRRQLGALHSYEKCAQLLMRDIQRVADLDERKGLPVGTDIVLCKAGAIRRRKAQAIHCPEERTLMIIV